MSLFRQASFSDFDFNLGNGAEYILVGDDYLVFSAAGIIQRVSIAAPGQGTSDFWRIESLVEGEINILYQGAYIQVEERFKLIKDRARLGRSCRSKTTFKSLLLISLLTAVSISAIAGVVGRYDRKAASSQEQIDFSELVDAMKQSGMDYSDPLSPLTDRAALSPEELLKRRSLTDPTQVFPKLTPDPADTPVDAAASQSLPKYSPDLYAGDTEFLPVQVDKATAAEEKAPQEAATDAETEALKAEIESEMKKLTPDQASDALRKISMLRPDQMKGEALASLPSNLRALIERAYAAPPKPEQEAPGISSTTENGVPTKLIILPPSVIDSYRTYDGISSIPENTSWQARGNPTVHIPLPGGGDIQSVTDLEKFGLKP